MAISSIFEHPNLEFYHKWLRSIFSTLFQLRAEHIIYHASFTESMDNPLSVSHAMPAVLDFKLFQSAPFGGGAFPSSRNLLTLNRLICNYLSCPPFLITAVR
jgi:hypothetical protein